MRENNIKKLTGKNTGRAILSVLLILSMVMMIGCGKANDSVGESYVSLFSEADSTEPSEVVEYLINNSNSDMQLISMEVEPGFLNGFDVEISGFNRGAVFAPMIGSIPFIGYVFETENPSALMEELKSGANLRWNICTEADEMVCADKGNLVFFMMCTNEE